MKPYATVCASLLAPAHMAILSLVVRCSKPTRPKFHCNLLNFVQYNTHKTWCVAKFKQRINTNKSKFYSPLKLLVDHVPALTLFK